MSPAQPAFWRSCALPAVVVIAAGHIAKDFEELATWHCAGASGRPVFPGSACSARDDYLAEIVAGGSLHAGIRVPQGQRNRLERLCRYLLRPAVVADRLSRTADGKVCYCVKKPWRDGSVAVEMTPLTFLSRLAALIPAPRANLTTYHGLLAPAASYAPSRACSAGSPL